MKSLPWTVALLLCPMWSTAVTAQDFPAPIEPREELGTPPVAPARPAFVRLPEGQPGFGGAFLNLASREESRQFYNLVFQASEGVPMDWSGTYAVHDPGTNSTAYLQAVLRRVNYFRKMAGLPAAITFDPDYTRKAQATAYLMGANNRLDHFPTPDWWRYSAEGADGATNSNISLGHAGPQAIVGQVRDNGGNNAAVGHRRWILHPQTRIMGSGSVSPTGTNAAASALWVFDDHAFDPRPATREAYVAWPPPGFVPYPVVYARWSFAQANADFSGASVTMTSNGVPLSVSVTPPENGYGENTLVWIPAGLNAGNNGLESFARPAADTVYRVTLNNVRIANVPRSFTYDVTVFDPAVPGSDSFPPLISGPAQPAAGLANLYTFTAVSNANAYEWRQSRPTNLAFVDGAETGLGNFTVQAATNLYSVRDSGVKFAGTYSFHLTHTQAVSQTLTLNRLLLATSNSAVQFRSRLGWASSAQIAKVQVSLDDGSSWFEVFAQAGSNGSGEGTFNLRAVALGLHAGRTLRLRLNYELNSGSYFPQASSGVGWYVDDLTLTNFQEATASSLAATESNRTFNFTPAGTGPYLLEVRPVLFGDYPGEWGPVLNVTAVANVRITRLQKVSGNTWHLDFNLLGGAAAGFQLWAAPAVDGTFVHETGATIQTVVPGSQYRAVVTGAGAQRFFQIKVL